MVAAVVDGAALLLLALLVAYGLAIQPPVTGAASANEDVEGWSTFVLGPVAALLVATLVLIWANWYLDRRRDDGGAPPADDDEVPPPAA